MDPPVENTPKPSKESPHRVSAKDVLTQQRVQMESQWESFRNAKIKISPEYKKDRMEATLQSYWDGASASHAIQCAVHRVAQSRFMIGELRDVVNSEVASEPRKRLAQEAIDELEFQRKLNSSVADLMTADLLTYEKVHDPNVADDVKMQLVDRVPDRKRGIYPEVTTEVSNLREPLLELNVELEERIKDLPPGNMRSIEKAYQRFNQAQGEAVGSLFDRAISANEDGNTEDLDIAMKELVGHYADGAFILEDVYSDNWLKEIKDIKTGEGLGNPHN